MSEGQRQEAALREAMQAAEATKNLGRMAAVSSLARNLRTEDQAYRRSLLGDTPSTDMEIMAAGPVTINHYASPSEPSPQASSPPSADPAAQPGTPQQPAAAPAAQPSAMDRLKEAALRYALPAVLGAGLGGAAAAYVANQQPAPPAVDFEHAPLDLLPPDAQ